MTTTDSGITDQQIEQWRNTAHRVWTKHPHEAGVFTMLVQLTNLRQQRRWAKVFREIRGD